MRKSSRLGLAVLLATIACVGGESSACWWWRHADRRHWAVPACASPTYPAPVVIAPAAPAAWPVLASRQAPAAPAAPLAAVRTFRFRGKTHRAIPTVERGESEEREVRARSPFAASAMAGDGEHFAGTARKAAKTSFSGGRPRSFDSPGAVLDSILKGTSPADNDSEMRAKLNSNSPRAPEERRNAIVTAFLYATKKEADNDFHLLLGDAPEGGDGRFLTAEVSGLPVPDDRRTPAFRQVRDQYKAFFAAIGLPPPGDRYVRFDPPVPVTVAGSLFFDVDHLPGQVRSGPDVPETVWEIHPVSHLDFGPTAGP
jgi:hypothetical protein